ncbi:MAG: efflux RND transporter periplasmic adaptor subunit [Chitinivibrionales bacterium]|nr:efflux RND transporter periplasmic adaptor subunit [Chitinivibrionales bacterium]
MKIKKQRLFIIALVVSVLAAFLVGRISKGTGSQAHSDAAAAKDAGEDVTWTCSMHPQIQLPEPGQCPICFMDLIPVNESEAGGEHEAPATLTLSKHAAALAGIQTIQAVRRGATAKIRMAGKIDFNETKVEMITSRMSGRIDRLYVDYTGIPVKRGDHLARIYSPELVSLQRELLEAKKAANRLDNTGISGIAEESITRTLEAAKEKLRLLGFSDAELNAILSRGTTSEHMTIRAGQQGVVIKKLVDEGMYVQTGTPLFHIADLQSLWVKLDAYESDLAWLRLGQKATFSVEAWPGENFKGTISFIDPAVDPETRTVKVRVIVDNKEKRLKPEMLVTARVKAHVSKSGKVKGGNLKGKWISPMHPQIVKDGPGTCDICGMPLVPAEELGYVTSGFEDVDPLVVPSTAPLITGERAIVYVRLPDKEKPTFEGREVVLGPRVGDYYVVKSGISEGEPVVVNGAFKIDSELQIRAKPSMMNPGHGTTAQASADKTHPAAAPAKVSGTVSTEFRKKLNGLFEKYFALANALAGDDLAKSKKAMESLQNHIAATDAPQSKLYKAWRSAKSNLLEALKQKKDIKDLSDARMVFEKISGQVIILQKHYETNTDDHYLAFCPMAFGNEGAYWLQKKKEIRNPYFGASMLKCGEIKESYPSPGQAKGHNHEH